MVLKTLNPYSNDTYGGHSSEEEISEQELLLQHHGYQRFHYVNNNDTRIRITKNPCRNLWNNPAIHADGPICPYTYNYNEQYTLGILRAESFRNIWYRMMYQHLLKTSSLLALGLFCWSLGEVVVYIKGDRDELNP